MVSQARKARKAQKELVLWRELFEVLNIEIMLFNEFEFKERILRIANNFSVGERIVLHMSYSFFPMPNTEELRASIVQNMRKGLGLGEESISPGNSDDKRDSRDPWEIFFKNHGIADVSDMGKMQAEALAVVDGLHVGERILICTQYSMFQMPTDEEVCRQSDLILGKIKKELDS